MKNIIIAFIFFTIQIFATTEQSSDFSIVLYQPNSSVGKNFIGGVSKISSFIKNVQKIWENIEPSLEKRKKSVLVVSIGYKRLPSAWIIDENENKLNEEVTKQLRLEQLPALSAGYFIFALQGKDYYSKSIPTPKEWMDLSKSSLIPMSINEIMSNILLKSFTKPNATPTGFIEQPLKAIEGSILKPKKWFYKEIPQPHGYTWILSKEDTKTSDYITGMKIQMLVDIKQGTGKTPQKFCEDFLDSKKHSLKIIHNYPKQQISIYTRKGIEAEEELYINEKKEIYHITYSTFWDNESDHIIVVTHGTTKDLWEKYKDTFSVMTKFKLWDSKSTNK